MDSLTDDSEFLPFLEAIPEAIYGVKGFHLLNDHLFIPLLNGSSTQRGLGDRIRDFILSCRNLDSKDPRRERGLIAGMKAIWALGMTSSRMGDVFNHEQSVWFPDVTYHAVSPRRIIMRLNLADGWPVSFDAAARVAILYSQANNLRNYIAFVAEADLEPAAFKTAITDIVQSAQKSIPCVAAEPIWLEIYLTIAFRFIPGAASDVFEGADPPHEYVTTLWRIVSPST
ncbi:hypothetical protein B0H16DRAFT_1732212 [Mycena metata]|uniref:Uncharacterized protein n=1 Tax=Mycena metata TaxID=1033252 RepID=A0AAD7MUJ9_9AGAR|nr:hypothetical protein B0H16DRAFT_1732212 [Mycena metata]